MESNTILSPENHNTFNKFVPGLQELELVVVDNPLGNIVYNNPFKIPIELFMIIIDNLGITESIILGYITNPEKNLMNLYLKFLAYKINLHTIRFRTHSPAELYALETPNECYRSHTIRLSGYHPEYIILYIDNKHLRLRLTVTEYNNYVNPAINTLLLDVLYNIEIINIKHFSYKKINITGIIREKTKILYKENIGCCTKGKAVEFDLRSDPEESYQFIIIHK